MTLPVSGMTYTADSFQKDQVAYHGVLNTTSVKDEVRLARTAPKPTATFSGVGRTSAKLTATLPLTGALTPTGDMIIDIQATVPVGATTATVEDWLTALGVFVGSASFKSHVNAQKISY